jgi:hypothetical protein
MPLQTEYAADAVKALGAAEAGAKKQAKMAKGGPQTGRFPAGFEWEVVTADTTILNGATNVLRFVSTVCTDDDSDFICLVKRIWAIFSACEYPYLDTVCSCG